MTPSFLSFALACLVIELTPGPNMSWLAVFSLERGRKAGLAAVAGIALGLSVAMFASALGLAALIERAPTVYEFLRWGGVAYLLYLAGETWHGANKEADPRDLAQMGFWRGLIFNSLNPKAYLFYLTVLSEFIPANGPFITQAILYGLFYVFVATSVHAAIVLLTGLPQNFLQNKKWRPRFQRFMALLLAIVAFWFAWSTAR